MRSRRLRRPNSSRAEPWFVFFQGVIANPVLPVAPNRFVWIGNCRAGTPGAGLQGSGRTLMRHSTLASRDPYLCAFKFPLLCFTIDVHISEFGRSCEAAWLVQTGRLSKESMFLSSHTCTLVLAFYRPELCGHPHIQ